MSQLNPNRTRERLLCRRILLEFQTEILDKSALADTLGVPYLIGVDVRDEGIYGHACDVKVFILDLSDAEIMFANNEQWPGVKQQALRFSDPITAVCQYRDVAVFLVGERDAPRDRS